MLRVLVRGHVSVRNRPSRHTPRALTQRITGRELQNPGRAGYAEVSGSHRAGALTFGTAGREARDMNRISLAPSDVADLCEKVPG
jgi:hypothetical protein